MDLLRESQEHNTSLKGTFPLALPDKRQEPADTPVCLFSQFPEQVLWATLALYKFRVLGVQMHPVALVPWSGILRVRQHAWGYQENPLCQGDQGGEGRNTRRYRGVQGGILPGEGTEVQDRMANVLRALGVMEAGLRKWNRL